MEEYLRLKDEFKIDDSHSNIRGFVICKTEDGKVIFTKENMIVKEGRKIILKRLLGLNEIEVPAFYPISGNEYRMTTPDDNISTEADMTNSFGSNNAVQEDKFREVKLNKMLENDIKYENDIITEVKDEKDLPEGSYCVNLDDLYIHFKLQKASGGYGGVTSSFGLAIKVSDSPEDGDTGYRLFSRVTFPSYPDSATLIFDYYIYF